MLLGYHVLLLLLGCGINMALLGQRLLLSSCGSSGRGSVRDLLDVSRGGCVCYALGVDCSGCVRHALGIGCSGCIRYTLGVDCGGGLLIRHLLLMQ